MDSGDGSRPTVGDQNGQTVGGSDGECDTWLGGYERVGLAYAACDSIGLEHESGVNLLEARHLVLRESGHTSAETMPDTGDLFEE
jgi:hypothetical protein